MTHRRWLCVVFVASVLAVRSGRASEETFRLYHGITMYIDNPVGKSFTVTLDLRDLNVYANGPREVLFKVYDPDGRLVVREIIPDDGVASNSYGPRLGGWDHELNYYALCYSRGSVPMVRWSGYSDPKYVATLAKRTFTRTVKGGKGGVYRVLLVGERDHLATLKISPDLSYAVCGHHTWLHGRGDQWKQSYIYVPRGTSGLHLAFAEPDRPRTRRFTLTAPDGKKLFDGQATGSFVTTTHKFDRAGQYDDQILTLRVSDGPGDYLLHIALQQPKKGPYKDYVGMGVEAVLARDPKTARAVRGGAIYEDGKVFWHPFQVRLHRWLQKNSAADEVRAVEKLFRLLGPSDGRGAASWTNWGYAFGYYGCKVWRPAWLLMKSRSVPKDAKDIIREGLIVGGDRLSFAIGIERVNGNAFAQIPVALWYCQKATGDTMQKARYEVFFERFRHEGWGEGVGVSRSGDCQEHFAHDNHYGFYILENWYGGTWVKRGILSDTDDPRFQKVADRISTLYSYIWCRYADANPWSARTHHSFRERGWRRGRFAWMGDPGPSFTVSVNDGNEWFAARRRGYYAVTFHGRLAPAWLSYGCVGQVGFGGGILCQLTVPGRGTVLHSRLWGSYGKQMALDRWRDFQIHSIVGTMADGRPFVSAVGEHPNARLTGTVVKSSGEVRDRSVRVRRTYDFGRDEIRCEAHLEDTDYAPLLTLWGAGAYRRKSTLREAYEMIPYGQSRRRSKPATVRLLGANGQAIGTLRNTATEGVSTIVIDRGGYGVRIRLPRPYAVLKSNTDSLLIRLIDKNTPAKDVGISYRLQPFGK